MSFVQTLRSLRPRLQFAALTHELPAVVEGLRQMGVGTIIDFAMEHRPAAESAHVAHVIASRLNEFPSAMHAVKLSALGSEENHSRRRHSPEESSDAPPSWTRRCASTPRKMLYTPRTRGRRSV